MFQYEYEKRPPSATSRDSRATIQSCDSRTTIAAEWSASRRPLPPRPVPIICERMPTKHTVPLKVWIIASASCFAVCAALVLATVVITKWGATDSYAARELFEESPEPIYSKPQPTTTESNEIKDLQIIEKLSIFKNIVSNRKEKKENLNDKPQMHPLHDTTIEHIERKIEKKDKPKTEDIKIPTFKPTLPDLVLHKNVPEYFKNDDYEEYYNDVNLYEDYIQSNSMTSYLIEKVQELHDWITSDDDFSKNSTGDSGTQFGQVLKALNESLVEGNVTIVMNKLKDLYFGNENYNHSRKIILTNSTDLLSFGILTLDVILLHNIQLMAWENQETARNKMMKDPDVFTFNALFLDPNKIEAKQNEVYHHYDPAFAKRQNLRQDSEDFDIGKNLLENALEIGMSTARAAIHLGRAYKNAKNVLTQLSTREINTNIQNQISRNIDGNTQALKHLETSYNKNDSSVASSINELDCIWMLYCKNLVATSKLNPPYGTMAKINGIALRMLSGELSADRALDTMLYEVLTGWSDLKCNDMFPRCSNVNAASVVMDSILLPLRKSLPNRSR